MTSPASHGFREMISSSLRLKERREKRVSRRGERERRDGNVPRSEGDACLGGVQTLEEGHRCDPNLLLVLHGLLQRQELLAVEKAGSSIPRLIPADSSLVDSMAPPRERVVERAPEHRDSRSSRNRRDGSVHFVHCERPPVSAHPSAILLLECTDAAHAQKRKRLLEATWGDKAGGQGLLGGGRHAPRTDV